MQETHGCLQIVLFFLRGFLSIVSGPQGIFRPRPGDSLIIACPFIRRETYLSYSTVWHSTCRPIYQDRATSQGMRRLGQGGRQRSAKPLAVVQFHQPPPTQIAVGNIMSARVVWSALAHGTWLRTAATAGHTTFGGWIPPAAGTAFRMTARAVDHRRSRGRNALLQFGTSA